MIFCFIQLLHWTHPLGVWQIAEFINAFNACMHSGDLTVLFVGLGWDGFVDWTHIICIF